VFIYNVNYLVYCNKNANINKKFKHKTLTYFYLQILCAYSYYTPLVIFLS